LRKLTQPKEPVDPPIARLDYLVDTQITHPTDAHIAKLMAPAKIHGHGDE